MNESRHEGLVDSARRRLARFMAVDDGLWSAMQVDSKLGADIVFQGLALLLCSTYFGWAIFNIASNLLGYPLPGAVLSTLMIAGCLGATDRHVMIQSRGAPDLFRALSIKIRLLSVCIIAIGSFLMATNSFKDDIGRVLFEQGRQQRAALEASPEYAAELGFERNRLRAGERQLARISELHQEHMAITDELARTWEARENECQGNTTKGQTRVRGCGAKARGHEAAANRLRQQLEAVQAELAQLEGVPASIGATKTRLDEINRRIEADVERSVRGPSKKIGALIALVRTNAVAALTVAVWLLIGMLPDVMMWIALGRSPNAAAHTRARVILEQAFDGGLARLRAELREKQAEGLAIIDFRPAPIADSKAVSDKPKNGKEGA